MSPVPRHSVSLWSFFFRNFRTSQASTPSDWRVLSSATKYSQSGYSSVLPAEQPFFLFREDFSILSHNPFKMLILNMQSKILRRELTFTPKYSQHTVILNFKHSSFFSLPASSVSKVLSGQKTVKQKSICKAREITEKCYYLDMDTSLF